MQKDTILDLYDRYADMVYRIALSYLKNQHDAEDAVQSVFMKFIDGRAFPEAGKEKAFITRICINHCKDVFRSAWRNKIDITEDLTHIPMPKEDETLEIVMALPLKYRLAIYLHFYEGYTFKEIGNLLNISSSAVSMRIHRGKKLLEELLLEDSNESNRKSYKSL